MASQHNIDGIILAEILQSKGFADVKSKTKTSIVLAVDGNRVEHMKSIAAMFKNLDARIDPNVAGSSIGAIIVADKIKITLKPKGRAGGGGLDVEAAAIATLQSALSVAIMSNGAPIDVRLRGRTVKNCAQVIKTAGTPKSDFHIADPAGRPLIHISHKKGSTPRDFQQWGGLTETRIVQHREVKAFITKCQLLYGSAIPSGESVYMPIKDKDLKMMAIFGVDYDKAGISENKVDVLIQGDPGIKQFSGGSFELTATGHLHHYGDLPTGGFDPVLAMIYKGDRDQFGIRGARASIYPAAGRTFKGRLDQKLKGL